MKFKFYSPLAAPGKDSILEGHGRGRSETDHGSVCSPGCARYWY